MTQEFKLGKKSQERLSTVVPVLQEIVHETLARSLYDFGIPKYGGLRTIEDQEYLLTIGKSKTLKSKHLEGKAVDICRYMGKDENGTSVYSFSKEDLAPIAEIMLEVAEEKGVKLVWGGNWTSFVDAPHFEMEV